MIPIRVLQLRKIRLPANLATTAISLSLILDAISRTADFLEIINSATGVTLVILIVLIFIFNLALSLYSRASKPYEGGSESETRHQRRKREKLERRAAVLYRAISLLLVTIVVVLGVSLITVVLRTWQLSEVIGELRQQEAVKAQYQPDLYKIPPPPPGAIVHLWEDFEELDFYERLFVHNGYAEVFTDTAQNNSQYLKTESGETSQVVIFSSVDARLGDIYREIHLRVRLLNPESQKNDFEQRTDDTLISLFDGEWHTLSVQIFETGRVNQLLDGILLPHSEYMNDIPPMHEAYLIGFLDLGIMSSTRISYSIPGELVQNFPDGSQIRTPLRVNDFLVLLIGRDANWGIDDVIYWSVP